MDIIKAVSNRLSELCKERNITVNRLANLSAVPPSTIKNIVYGLSKNPKIITIKMLCDGLELLLQSSLINLLSTVIPKITAARNMKQVMPIVAQ